MTRIMMFTTDYPCDEIASHWSIIWAASNNLSEALDALSDKAKSLGAHAIIGLRMEIVPTLVGVPPASIHTDFLVYGNPVELNRPQG
ncbi:YbjQ family protein [Peterkaempfera griseoplana]|uniref:hypothetical protein n=1 Tax=Peterkaempfera griseoplana TaxID=66896 RepID=UPI0012FEFFF6|nr:hypothetical protein [Peterkaempfera griseoplana]